MAKKSNFQAPLTIGFAAGIAAGAAGVYFFATDRGKDFRKEMNDLWEEARPELIKKEVIEKSDETLGQAIKSFLIEVAVEETHKAQVTAKKRVRQNKMLFKGV